MSPRHKTQLAQVAALRDFIARALVRLPNESPERLGLITLKRHQRAGAARLREILRRDRGALLADEVGLGKTYTALSVAQDFAHVEIVGPAALRAMWHEACARCDIPAEYVTAESLSRASAPARHADLVIVDEAHWFRNPATRRYRQLALRCRSAAVLLLSATPLHNRSGDLNALLALFLGARAGRLTPHAIAQLTVRRGRAAIPAERPPPVVLGTRWWRVPVDATLRAALDAIEPPVPLRDSAVVMALLRLTLHRRLSSSHAALRATLRRMLARALAMLQAVRAGQLPRERELRAWLVSDEAIQLVLPGFAFTAAPNESVATDAVERHIASLRAALTALDAAPDSDRRRAALLERVLRTFPDTRIVAFSQYEATVRSLGRLLRSRPGVVVLSAKGGRIASGHVSRGEILRQFDAAGRSPVARNMHMQLLLTTDLLSEGVNLHNASVVVHLDLPWTAARLEQRVGRVSRLGSLHDAVHVFGFAPPRSVVLLERNVARLRAKWRAASKRFGDTPLLARDALVQGAVVRRSAFTSARESLLLLLHDWLGIPSLRVAREAGVQIVAYAAIDKGSAPSALALLGCQGEGWRLVAITRSAVSAHPAVILRVARTLSAAVDAPPRGDLLRTIGAQLARYLARERAAQRVEQNCATRTALFLREVARAVASLPRQDRPAGVALEGRIRALLASASSAGDLQVVDDGCASLVACVGRMAPLDWLELARTTLNVSAPSRVRVGTPERRWHVAAILIGS